MDRAVVNVWAGVSDDGMRAFFCRRASLALESCDCADEASLERRDCCRDERMDSSEELWEVADGIVGVRGTSLSDGRTTRWNEYNSWFEMSNVVVVVDLQVLRAPVLVGSYDAG